MVFTPPAWVPQYPSDAPDSISVEQFMHDEKYGRVPHSVALNPFTCGLSGRTFSSREELARSDFLARGLADDLGWAPNCGSEWDKVVGIFSLNTVDTTTLSYAIHKLNGIVTPANAAYSIPELEYQMRSSGARAIFTCLPLLESTVAVAKKIGISEKNIYILSMPKAFSGEAKTSFKDVDELITSGQKLPALEPLKWKRGQGAKQVAFLCYSSGTSGLPKGVMISHRNVIANILAMKTYESPVRSGKGKDGRDRMDVALGLLPMSHIYGLVVVTFSTTYRGDEVIVLPKFDLTTFLTALSRFKISALYLVPPIIITLVNNQSVCSRYNLSSVKTIFTGAAPLGAETAQEIQDIYPDWKIRQGYGLTETCTVVSSSIDFDIHFGTSGSLLPGFKCRLMSLDGTEIVGYDQPGELLVQSPSVVLGYLNNEKANTETFFTDENGDQWMRTGDEAIFSKAPSGNEHLTITDRIKELIKVKGLQVAPAELEAHLLSHPSVGDVAVIPVPDDAAGEVPKAYVVKSSEVGLEENDRMTKRSIQRFVEQHKARHKWLKGGVEFVDVIPKSPSGKILRRLLKDKEKEKRRAAGAKL